MNLCPPILKEFAILHLLLLCQFLYIFVFLCVYILESVCVGGRRGGGGPGEGGGEGAYVVGTIFLFEFQFHLAQLAS